MPTGTALVVDGDWRMRKLIRTNLEAQGWQVIEATNGGEGLERLRQGACDLILLNADLPDSNGWSIVRRLREEGSSSPAPIIVIAAEPASRRLLQRFPAVSQLLTPFSAHALLECIRRSTGTRAALA